MKSQTLLAVACAASALAHLGLGLVLVHLPLPPLALERHAERFDVRMIELPAAPAPSEPLAPEAARAPPPAASKPAPIQPKPPPPRVEAPEPQAVPPAPPAEPSPLLPEAPAALVNEGIGNAFGVATGSGRGAAGLVASVAAPEPPAPARAAPPAVTPLADLSRKPRAPQLDDRLRSHYPPDLRRRGIEGQALVRVLLSARGRVDEVSILSESAPGFAVACRNTLLGSAWSEPLDRNGNAVATRLTYRCRFQIER